MHENEHFKQKKRNRPIAITDIAIKKIPLLELPGFSAEENQYIYEQHVRLLTEAKKYNSYEVGILVDIIEWKDYIIYGTENEVEMRKNKAAYEKLEFAPKNTLLFMHNHPSTGTFSGTDFKTFCKNGAIYIITVVGNDGNVRALVKEHDFNETDALLYYYHLANEKYVSEKNNGTLAMRELLKNSRNIGLEYKKGGLGYGTGRKKTDY